MPYHKKVFCQKISSFHMKFTRIIAALALFSLFYSCTPSIETPQAPPVNTIAKIESILKSIQLNYQNPIASNRYEQLEFLLQFYDRNASEQMSGPASFTERFFHLNNIDISSSCIAMLIVPVNDKGNLDYIQIELLFNKPLLANERFFNKTIVTQRNDCYIIGWAIPKGDATAYHFILPSHTGEGATVYKGEEKRE